mgnify:FL=1
MVILALLSSGQLTIADNVSRIYGYSDQEISSSARQMAMAISKSAPIHIDSITTLVDAFYDARTNSFTYKYISSQYLSKIKGREIVVLHTCSDRIRRAYMAKGLRFVHTYQTPNGEVSFDVTVSDCS